jgi:hypothetical protein
VINRNGATTTPIATNMSHPLIPAKSFVILLCIAGVIFVSSMVIPFFLKIADLEAIFQRLI